MRKEQTMECCNHRTKKRDESEKKKLTNRLKRIEGQVRGVCGMIENDAYCNDVLVQILAIRSAVDAFSRELLESHIKSCVVNDIKEGREETVDELVKTVSALIK